MLMSIAVFCCILFTTNEWVLFLVRWSDALIAQVALFAVCKQHFSQETAWVFVMSMQHRTVNIFVCISIFDIKFFITLQENVVYIDVDN